MNTQAAVLPNCIVVPATTLLDSPLAPFLIFMVAVIVVAGVAIAVTFLVQRQKLYQLQVSRLFIIHTVALSRKLMEKQGP